MYNTFIEAAPTRRVPGVLIREKEMARLYKIDYRSGVESEQVAEDELCALRVEFEAAGAEMPEVEKTFSGGDWDFAVYAADEPQAPFSTAYFAVV